MRKQHIIYWGAFLLGIASVDAATTITASNLKTADTADRAVINNAGDFIGLNQGSVEVGYFISFSTAGDFTSANRNTLLADFQQFSTTTKSFQNASNAVGFYNVSFVDSINAGSPFDGKTIYTIIGNASTLSASSEFLVFEHTGTQFAIEQAGLGAENATVRPTDGTLMLGSDSGDKHHPLDVTVGTYQMALVPVPEPSSLALLGLGMVGFTLRRRR